MKRLRPIEHEIEEELRFHLEMRAQQNQAAGMAAEAAHADALQRFGDYETVKTQCREIAKEKLANSLARRFLNALVWAMLGGGWTLRWLSDIGAVQHCGAVLMAIAVTWRLLLYVRLNGLLRQPEALSPTPVLPIEPLAPSHCHSAISHYDTQGRTPVERVLADDE